MKNNAKDTDDVFELINLVFLAHKDGRVDKEEALLIIELLFSGELDAESRSIIKYICLRRPLESFADMEPLQVSPRSHYYS